MMQRNTDISRPRKYTPTQVGQINFYNLARQLSLVSNDKISMGYSQMFRCEANSAYHARYIRSDYRFVNLFGAVQDAEYKQIYGTITDFINAYLRDVKDTSKPIRLADVTLLPLNLVKYNRNHFNTLLIVRSGDTVYVRLVEPKASNNSSGRLFIPYKYPANEILEAIKARFQAADFKFKVDIQQIALGVQPMFNDHDCGAHHINAVSALATADIDTIIDCEKLKLLLRNQLLSTRDDDRKLLAIFRTEYIEENGAEITRVGEKIMQYQHLKQSISYPLSEDFYIFLTTSAMGVSCDQPAAARAAAGSM